MDNSNKLTFKEMEDLVNQWLDETKDEKSTFINQADGVNSLLKKKDFNDSMTRNIHSKLTMVNHMDDMFVRDVTILNKYAAALEDLVNKFEQNPDIPTNSENSYDAVREQIYSATENLNKIVNNLNCEVDMVQSDIEEKETKSFQNPVDASTKVMDCLLRNLESIDHKLHQMQHIMQIIDHEKKKLSKYIQ